MERGEELLGCTFWAAGREKARRFANLVRKQTQCEAGQMEVGWTGSEGAVLEALGGRVIIPTVILLD